MVDTTKKTDPENDTASGAPGDGDEERTPSVEQSPADLAAAVETLKGQIDDLTDRLLRAHAEMDNIRKRAEREKDETAKYAITRFARDIVTVADNFERAVQAVPQGAAEQDVALKSLVDGVSMTERELLNVLERYGVKRVSPKGEMFNPHQHQAMMEMQNLDVAPGTILEVFQPGYLIEDRVLRPAMVIVAKGGQKAPKPEEATSDASSDTGETPGDDAA